MWPEAAGAVAVCGGGGAYCEDVGGAAYCEAVGGGAYREVVGKGVGEAALARDGACVVAGRSER
jgi:hypothetical protein